MAPRENADLLKPIQKADFELSYLLSEGGYLMPAQAKKFIRLATKNSVILQDMNVYGTRAQKQKLNKIRFGDRVLKAGSPGAALPSGDRVRPDLTETELDTQMFKCHVEIEDEVFEDNIEGDSLRNTIMQMLGKAISRDMEWVVINGDTTSADPVLAKFDGLLKSSTSHAVSNAGADLDDTGMAAVRKALPHEYKTDPKAMRVWTSVNAEQDFGDTVAGRATNLGDKYFDDRFESRYRKTPVVAVPEWPENYGGADTTAGLYLDPKSAHVGIWKNIKLRTTEDVEAGLVIIVGKIRFDFKYENEDAVAKLEDVSAD